MDKFARKFRVLAGWVVIICIVAMLSSCSSKPEKAIVGKWKEIGGSETMEFFKDGTLSIADDSVYFGGNYKFIDKDSIKMELGGSGAMAGPVVARVSITGEELTITMPGDEASKFRKSK